MFRKIDQDHRRFRDIVRGRIKQNLRKYITQGQLIGKKGKDVVSIPVPHIDIPHFRFGPRSTAKVIEANPCGRFVIAAKKGLFLQIFLRLAHALAINDLT